MTDEILDSLIIGGGMTGLACAYTLKRANAERKTRLKLKLWEARAHVGGTIATTRRDGFIIEHGPDAFLSEKPYALSLVEELGLTHELLETNPEHRQSLIFSRGKLHSMPPGFYLIAPGQLWPFAFSSLISPFGKLRMLMDLVIPRKTNSNEENISTFIMRRLGREALERIGQPMVAGIYTGDPNKLSAEWVLPKFCEMEAQHGSLIRALMRRKQRTAGDSRGPRYSLFLSFKKGLDVLPRKLQETLGDTVQLNTPVTRVEWRPTESVWCVQGAGESVRSKTLCLATPAHVTQTLLQSQTQLTHVLGTLKVESVAMLNLAYARHQVRHPLNAFGFVVPSCEKRSMLACSFSSVKFQARAPHDVVLMRVFVGGAFGREFYNMPDQELRRVVEADLAQILGIKGKALFCDFTRYPNSMPQYETGHTQRVHTIERELKSLPGLYLAGSAFKGVGIPDCIRQGEESAQSILAYLR